MRHLKIRFIQSAVGRDFSFNKGEVRDLPLSQAKDFIKSNIAIPFVELKTEKAVVTAKETRDVQDKHSTSIRTDNIGSGKDASKSKRVGRGQSDNKSDSSRKATRRKVSKKKSN